MVVFPLVLVQSMVVQNVEENLLLVEVRNEYNDVLLILLDVVVVGMEDDMVGM
jgi:hypothetical protein